MARHSNAGEDRPELVDAGAMHKYAAPRVPIDHALQAHGTGLELQAVAVDLSQVHAREWRRTQRVNRMRRTAWLLVAVAALLLAAVLLPVGTWWQEFQDAAASG